MNRVNPLYLGLFLLVVLVLSVFKLNSAKHELKEVRLSYKETSKIANELTSLKSVYNDKNNLEKSLKRVLKQKLLKGIEIDTIFKKNNVKISSQSIDKKALDFLMGKILNSTYNVVSLDIKKLSEEKASLKMEIKW